MRFILLLLFAGCCSKPDEQIEPHYPSGIFELQQSGAKVQQLQQEQTNPFELQQSRRPK